MSPDRDCFRLVPGLSVVRGVMRSSQSVVAIAAARVRRSIDWSATPRPDLPADINGTRAATGLAGRLILRPSFAATSPDR